jgi:hypothetical protein
MARVIPAFPFTLFGLPAIVVFVVAETLGEAGTTGTLTESRYAVGPSHNYPTVADTLCRRDNRRSVRLKSTAATTKNAMHIHCETDNVPLLPPAAGSRKNSKDMRVSGYNSQKSRNVSPGTPRHFFQIQVIIRNSAAPLAAK